MCGCAQYLGHMALQEVRQEVEGGGMSGGKRSQQMKEELHVVRVVSVAMVNDYYSISN